MFQFDFMANFSMNKVFISLKFENPVVMTWYEAKIIC